MTVAEYKNKFSQISRFVPYDVDNVEKKTRRFEQGLRQWIQNRVAVLEITSVQMETVFTLGIQRFLTLEIHC